MNIDTIHDTPSMARVEHSSSEPGGRTEGDVVVSKFLRRPALLDMVLDKIDAALCICSRTMEVEFANERYAALWELSANVLVPGTPLLDALAKAPVFHPANAEAMTSYLAWCRALGVGEDACEIRVSRERTYMARHTPLAQDGWLISLSDITAELTNEAFVNERLTLQSLIDTVPDYLYVKDVDSRFILANKALAQDWGLDPAEVVGLSDHDFHSVDLAASFKKAERTIIETGRPMIDHPEFVLDDRGNGKWFSSTKMPLKDVSGSTVGLVGIARDITELRSEISLREGQASILEMIATAAPLQTILDRIVLLIQARIADIAGSVQLGLPGGKECREGISLQPDAPAAERRDDEPRRALDRMDASLVVTDLGGELTSTGAHDAVQSSRYRTCWSMPIRSQDGVLGTLQLYASAARQPTADETAIIEIAARLTAIAVERQMAEERIRFMANHDALTGVANRSMLETLLAQTIADARREERRFLVLFLDLDDFKSINDDLGHHAGDELLKEFANRLTRCLNGCGSVIRLGGDEFVALLTDRPARAAEDSDVIARKIASITQPFLLGGNRLNVSCSVGVAAFPDDGDTPETLLAKADIAMYASKQNGKGRFTLYRAALG